MVVAMVVVALMDVEMFPDMLHALCEILIGGVRVQAKPTGDVCYGQVLIETEVEDAAVRLPHLLVHESRNVFEPFLLFFDGLEVGIGINGQQIPHFFVQLLLPYPVQTGIAHGDQ